MKVKEMLNILPHMRHSWSIVMHTCCQYKLGHCLITIGDTGWTLSQVPSCAADKLLLFLEVWQPAPGYFRRSVRVSNQTFNTSSYWTFGAHLIQPLLFLWCGWNVPYVVNIRSVKRWIQSENLVRWSSWCNIYIYIYTHMFGAAWRCKV